MNRLDQVVYWALGAVKDRSHGEHNRNREPRAMWIVSGWDDTGRFVRYHAPARRGDGCAEAIIAGEDPQAVAAQVEERASMSRGQLTYYFHERIDPCLRVYERRCGG